jgi:hypothetical protein
MGRTADEIDARMSPANTRPVPPVLPQSRAEWIALVLLVVGMMALRLPFLNTWQPAGDALNYAIGALRTHVAHPPGSVGYCVLVGWINQAVGQVFVTMLGISLVSCAAAIVVCHFLAKAVGLRWQAALLAAGIYGASANTLLASIICLPHVVEGLFAATFGLLAVLAVRRRSFAHAVGATAVLALAGAFRPTTTFLLVPAWLFLLWTTRPRAWQLLVHALVFAPIVGAWHFAGEHYMRKAGYGGATFDMQVMMPSLYEYASLSSTPERWAELRPTYHMPWFEVATWIDRHAGLNLLPHKATWPEPRLKRALTLVAMQTLKFSYFLVVSAPAFVVAGMAWLSGTLGRGRRAALPPAHLTWLLALWLCAPALFFVFGHMGNSTYLQLILPATAVVATYVLLGPAAFTGAEEAAPSPVPRAWVALALAPSVVGMLYFEFGRPLPSTTRLNRTINLVLNQFTGRSVTHPSIGNRASELVPLANPFEKARDDAGLMRVVDEEDFVPVPDVFLTRPRRPAATSPATQPLVR